MEPTFANALKGAYPLGRTLYIYVAKKPGEPMPKLVEEFLRFVLSDEGQQIVVKDGYGPLPAKVVAETAWAADIARRSCGPFALRQMVGSRLSD